MKKEKKKIAITQIYQELKIISRKKNYIYTKKSQKKAKDKNK